MTAKDFEKLAAEFMRSLQPKDNWTSRIAELLEHVHNQGYREGFGFGYQDGLSKNPK